MPKLCSFFILFISFATVLSAGDISSSIRAVNKELAYARKSASHTPPRVVITTLTIVFGVFGAILLIALAILFVHFFVVDISDYILCCLQKRGTNQVSRNIMRLQRCLLPGRCHHEPMMISRSNNQRTNVYRPHLVAASSPSLPACLNFRRIATEPARNQYLNLPSQLRSQNRNPRFPAASSARRHSFLSSVYANNMLAASQDLPNQLPIFHLPQPPSYDDAVAVPPSFGRRQLCHSLHVSSSTSILPWGQLPPPPAYEDIVSITPPPSQSVCDDISANISAEPTIEIVTTDSGRGQDTSAQAPPSSNVEEATVIPIQTCANTAEAANSPPTILSSYRNERSKSCRFLLTRPNAVINRSAISSDDTQTPAYDVTHVYSWHI